MKLLFKACLCSLLFLFAQLAGTPLKAETTYVDGHGGVPLAVTVTGPEDGPQILFLHGIGMGAEAFAPQLRSELAERFRMVAFDLRGHGMSGKPSEAEAYTLREVWAHDVAAVIAATGLDRPVIVAWSYGTLVTSDYLFAHGSESISGLVMVSAMGGLVTPTPPTEAPDPHVMAQMARYYELRKSAAFKDQAESVDILAPLLYEQTEDGPSEEWRENARILGLIVPPYVQAPLRSHPSENTSLARELRNTPIMLVHGAKDFAINLGDVERLRQVIPQIDTRMIDPGGHSPFAERPDEFNAMLSKFVDKVWSKRDDH